jgi:hypothetical protein
MGYQVLKYTCCTNEGLCGLEQWYFFHRSTYCQGFMNLAGRPVAAFDPEGLIFAAGINSESVKLYDLRSFDKGPFSSFKFPGETKSKALIR